MCEKDVCVMAVLISEKFQLSAISWTDNNNQKPEKTKLSTANDLMYFKNEAFSSMAFAPPAWTIKDEKIRLPIKK